ncbi:MAG: hypothetical protein K2L04_02070 [Alistipes sp.]|nr:hypothetical protein [Alistipes sp.]
MNQSVFLCPDLPERGQATPAAKNEILLIRTTTNIEFVSQLFFSWKESLPENEADHICAVVHRIILQHVKQQTAQACISETQRIVERAIRRKNRKIL